MSVDLVHCEFKTVREEEEEYPMELQTVEHNDNSQLKYFIKEPDCIFVRKKEDAYIQAKLVGIEDEDQTGNGDGYVDTELNLYRVSESSTEAAGKTLMKKKKKKKLEPSKTVLKFLVN